MPLAPGTKLGPYEIVAVIGAGGMGEVYRARDSRLNRQVAVKILPALFSSDVDRLRRFQQEAAAAATLNHPGILAVYDVGSQDGLWYVVSELLEGETLRDRLRDGALSRRKSVEYGIQIARALAAAHDKGIVHRDLKPENVFVTHDGSIKILDFGLAKLMPQHGSVAAGGATAATLTVETTPGLVLGTVGYMSPEQVRGLPADARSDIFALGAVLYEMLSGQQAFKGATPADIMSAILKEDPPELAETHREISPALERVVRHCLEKNPEERFRSAHDVAFDLENISQSSQLPAAVVTSPDGWLRSGLKPLLFIAALLAIAGAALLVWRGTRQPSLPTFRRLTFERGIVLSARFAGDGKNIIYAASWESKPVRLFSTLYDSPQPRPLEIDSASLLGISHTGEMAVAVGGKMTSHLVIRDAMLARAPIAGGAPREILEQVRAADWAPDGTLAVVHHVNGADRLEYPIGKVLYETGGWISHMRISPAGDRIAFMHHPGWPDDRGFVAIVDLAGNQKNLTQEWESAEGLAWSPNGDEIWFTAAPYGDRSLFAVTPSGKVRGLLRIPGGLTLHDVASDGRALLSFEDDLVGMRGAHDNGNERELTWLGWTVAQALTPDGTSVLFSEQAEPGGSSYLLGMRSLDGSVPKVLGEGSAYGVSSDGKWASATQADLRPEITLLPIGAGQPKRIPVPDLQVVQRAGFFPDGKRLIVDGAERVHARRTYAVDIATGKATPLTPEGVLSRALSKDGMELGAQDLSGSITIYSLQGKPPRSVPGTADMLPLEWSADGRSLFTTIPDEVPPGRVLRVDLATGRQELVHKLVPGDSGGVYTTWNVHVSHDGRSYVYSYRQTLSRLYVAEGLH